MVRFPPVVRPDILEWLRGADHLRVPKQWPDTQQPDHVCEVISPGHSRHSYISRRIVFPMSQKHHALRSLNVLTDMRFISNIPVGKVTCHSFN